MSYNTPIGGEYDFGLGIEPEIIAYIKESHSIQSRISPTKCYLLHRKRDGVLVHDSILDSPLVVNTWEVEENRYYFTLWNGSGGYPDIRPQNNEGRGSISVWIDGVLSIRVLDVLDIISDNEFAIVIRKLLDPQRVDVVFKEGFDITQHIVTYEYTTMNQGISDVRVKVGAAEDESMYGWEQYLNTEVADPLLGLHQILVRTPLTREGFTISDEGLVVLKENQCWMIWEPYVYANDMLVVPTDQSPNGRELRFNITDKQDSIIQGEAVSQRFRIVLIEPTDPRYKIPYIKE
jgi:hypothetical protein